MKTISMLAAIAGLLLLTFTSSCIGSRTKIEAQFPAAELAWPGVQADYLRGVDDGVEDGELEEAAAAELRRLGEELGSALVAQSTDSLRLVPWSKAMRPWADRGVEDKLADGEIGPTVAEVLRDRVVNFTETIESLQRIYR